MKGQLIKNSFLKILQFLFLFVLLTNKLYSQDVINLINGDSILTRVVEIDSDKVKYKLYNQQSGPDRIINKSEIEKIIFSDGFIEVINKPRVIKLTPVHEKRVVKQMNLELIKDLKLTVGWMDILNIKISPDNNYVLLVFKQGDSKKLILYDLQNERQNKLDFVVIPAGKRPTNPALDVGFTNDSKHFYCLTGRPTLYIYSVAGELVTSVKGKEIVHESKILNNDFIYNEDEQNFECDNVFVIRESDPSVTKLDGKINMGRVVAPKIFETRFSPSYFGFEFVSYLSNKELVATTNIGSKKVFLYNANSGLSVGELEKSKKYNFKYCPDIYEEYIIGQGSKIITIWKLDNKQIEKEIIQDDYFTDFSISRNNIISLASLNTGLKFLDINNDFQPILELQSSFNKKNCIEALKFSENSDYLVGVSKDDYLKVWKLDIQYK